MLFQDHRFVFVSPYFEKARKNVQVRTLQEMKRPGCNEIHIERESEHATGESEWNPEGPSFDPPESHPQKVPRNPFWAIPSQKRTENDQSCIATSLYTYDALLFFVTLSIVFFCFCYIAEFLTNLCLGFMVGFEPLVLVELSSLTFCFGAQNARQPLGVQKLLQRLRGC